MKKCKLIIIFLTLFVLSSFQNKSEDFHKIKDVDSFLSKIKTYTSETNSIKSNFSQEKHLNMLEEVLTSEGHFIFQKENKVLWEYLYPIDYAIIVYNGNFIIRDKLNVNKFDIESNKMFKEINNMIVTSVSGNFIDNPDFKASYFENNEFYLVNLIPLKPEVKDMLAEIEIYFDKKDISVSKLKFIEAGDDFTLIKFFNKEFNQPIPEQVFKVANID